MTPLTPAQIEELQIEAVVGAIGLLFMAQREERRVGERRRADRGELDRRAVEEAVDRL